MVMVKEDILNRTKFIKDLKILPQTAMKMSVKEVLIMTKTGTKGLNMLLSRKITWTW